MPRILCFFLCFLLYAEYAQAQTFILSGKVTDAISGEILVGVSIAHQNGSGTITDAKGMYRIRLDHATTHQLSFRYLGYELLRRQLNAGTDTSLVLDVQLKPKINELEQIIVTAGRFEQKREQLSISTSVVRTAQIDANNSVSADDVMNRTPGIHVLRGQINIRGSSGYSLGVGSRVLMLLDGLPLLTAEGNEILWIMLPIESAEQIEVIKGSGSALYGSAALGGVVHFRSIMPGATPVTRINWYNTFYDRPGGYHSDPWAGRQPPTAMGLSVAHSQRINKTDLTASLNVVHDDGFRVGEPSRRIRGNVHLRQQLGKKLYVGLQASHLVDSTRLFTFWESDTSAFMPNAGSTNAQLNTRTLIDPYIEYIGRNTKHSLRNRFYRSYTNYNNEDFGLGEMYYSEYQIQHRLPLNWANNTMLTAGLVNQLNAIRSDVLYGNQFTNNRAMYVQWDQNIGRFSYGMGFRYEQFIVNGSPKEQNPVLRAGLNYRLWKGGNLRASYGEGFRSPSAAEMFSNTFVGTVRFASDPNLLPESSRAFEIGFMQAIHAGRFKSTLDIALFRTDFRNLIEYTFGVFLPDVWDEQDSIWAAEGNLAKLAEKYARFQPSNITDARITGVEVIYSGMAQWQKFGLQFQAGYTFTNPINLNPPTFSFAGVPVDLLQFLKYRYRHLVRADFQLNYNRFMLGSNLRYNSVILNIDEDYYRFMPGLVEYRLQSINGDLLFDLRAGYALNDYFNLNLIVRNAGNRSWMPIPGNIGEQRSLVIQMLSRF
ncbi:MAG: TonB-dependent receptor [Bacteroidia bacterium]